MNQPEVKTESASSSQSRGDSQIPELDLPLQELTGRDAATAAAPRLRTAPPPPPPLAAFSVRPAPTAAAVRGGEYATPPAIAEGWSELAPSPSFVALSQAPRVAVRRWPQVVAVTAGAAAFLAAGYLAGATRWSSTPTLKAVSQAEHIVVKQLPAAAALAPKAEPAAAAETVAAKPLTVAPILTSTALSARAPEAEPIAAAVTDKPAAVAPAPSAAPTLPAAQEPATPVAPASAAAQPEPDASPAPQPAAAELDSAAPVAETSAAASVAVDPNLPELPTRDAVKDSLESVRAQLASCAGTAHGTTFANVTIAGSGRATYSTIEGAFAGTAQGSCMARALRSATFPQFSAPSFKVRYPFVF